MTKKIAYAPIAVESDDLVRNAWLNPADEEFTPRQHRELEAILSRHIPLVGAASRDHTRKKFDAVGELGKQDRLIRLTLELLDEDGQAAVRAAALARLPIDEPVY